MENNNKEDFFDVSPSPSYVPEPLEPQQPPGSTRGNSSSTEVRSPTSTATDAYTQGNVTVTGGAGAGATTSVYIGCPLEQLLRRADDASNMIRSKGSAERMDFLMKDTGAPRVPGPGYNPSALTVEYPFTPSPTPFY